jgi:hypothetical protein
MLCHTHTHTLSLSLSLSFSLGVDDQYGSIGTRSDWFGPCVFIAMESVVRLNLSLPFHLFFVFFQSSQDTIVFKDRAQEDEGVGNNDTATEPAKGKGQDGQDEEEPAEDFNASVWLAAPLRVLDCG